MANHKQIEGGYPVTSNQLFSLTKRQYFKSNIHHRRKIKREEKEIVAMLHASVTAYGCFIRGQVA